MTESRISRARRKQDEIGNRSLPITLITVSGAMYTGYVEADKVIGTAIADNGSVAQRVLIGTPDPTFLVLKYPIRYKIGNDSSIQLNVVFNEVRTEVSFLANDILVLEQATEKISGILFDLVSRLRSPYVMDESAPH